MMLMVVVVVVMEEEAGRLLLCNSSGPSARLGTKGPVCSRASSCLALTNELQRLTPLHVQLIACSLGQGMQDLVLVMLQPGGPDDHLTWGYSGSQRQPLPVPA